MKLLKYSFLVSVFAAASLPFSSCEKKEELEVCHRVVNQVTQINTPVYFVNCSKGAASYIWDFGDGNSSTEMEPVHSYDIKGIYRTNLEAFDADGAALTDLNNEVVVYDSTIPSQITIHEVTAVYYASINEDPWDQDGSGPDISLGIDVREVHSFETLFMTSNRYTDSQPGVEYLFNSSSGLPFVINDFSKDYEFTLYDYDGDEENYSRIEYPVSTTILEPYKNGLEPTGIIRLEGYKSYMELKVTWVY